MTKVLAYDSIEGIEQYLRRGIQGLRDLEVDRHEAGYKRQERLKDFCILGRWMTDTCGNFGKIISNSSMGELAPAEVIKDCPRVMTRDEACKLTGRVAWDGTNSHIPHPGMVCECCGIAWTIDNAHDALEFNGNVCINCEPFVGMELELFEKSIVSNIRYSRLFGEFLRNDRFIDLSPYDEKFKDMPKNRNGWVGKKELPAQYRFKLGDELNVTYFYWRHPACNQAKVDKEDREEMQEVFQKAGFVDFLVFKIPNQYWPPGSRHAVPPWYTFETRELGMITIGWRKRVISIEWSDSKVLRSVDTLKLFEKENVTKEKTLIHAWGYEKAVEYLSALRTAVANNTQGEHT